MIYKWNELFTALSDVFVSSSLMGTVQISSKVKIDSRSIKKGDIFVAIKGENTDGHLFIRDALQQHGALAYIYDNASQVDDDLKECGIQVTDSTEALKRIAQFHLTMLRRESADLKILAVTGSIGKTTVKNILLHLLPLNPNQKYATPGNFNTDIGVSLSILSMTTQVRTAIFEFGARYPGNIKSLCLLAKPDVVCLLNAKEAHLSEFKTLDQLQSTKFEIIKYMPANATGLINQEALLEWAGPLVEDLQRKGVNISTYSSETLKNKSAFVTSQAEGIDGGYQSVKISTSDNHRIFRSPWLHSQLTINLAAATSMALKAGFSLESLNQLEDYKSVPGRFYSLWTSTFQLIDDAYNASPSSMTEGFISLAWIRKSLKKPIKICCILGDMFELGSASLELHRQVGEACIQHAKPDLLITIGNHSLGIHEVAQHHRIDSKWYESTSEFLSQLTPDFFSKMDYVYVKASNGMKFSSIIDRLKN